MVVVTTNILVMPALFAAMHHLGKRSVLLLPGGPVVSGDKLLLLLPKLTRLSWIQGLSLLCYFLNRVLVPIFLLGTLR